MAAYQEIHEALTQSVIDLALGIPLAHENSDYDPEDNGDTQFVDITTLFNDQESLDKILTDEVTGIYQLSVYTKSGTSTKNAISVLLTLNTSTLLSDVFIDKLHIGESFSTFNPNLCSNLLFICYIIYLTYKNIL